MEHEINNDSVTARTRLPQNVMTGHYLGIIIGQHQLLQK